MTYYSSSTTSSTDPDPNRPVDVLQECINLQLKKGQDYQNGHSTVREADYWEDGVKSLYQMMHIKMLRIKSVMETEYVDADSQNFESIEDSVKDLINYASFMVSYMRGGMDGQNPSHDMFNRPKLED